MFITSEYHVKCIAIIYIAHTALYCTVLYCIHCTLMCCTVVYCIILYCTTLHCAVFIVLSCVVLWRTVFSCTVSHLTGLYTCTLMCCTILYCTVQQCTALYYSALHCTALAQIYQFCREDFNKNSSPYQSTENFGPTWKRKIQNVMKILWKGNICHWDSNSK